MSKAMNSRSIEHNVLELLVVTDLPPPQCEHRGQRSNVVHMGLAVPELYGVRHVSCGMGCIESTQRLTPEEIIMVRTKLDVIARLVEELQEFYDTKNYRYAPPPNIRQANMSTAMNVDANSTDTSDTESTTSTETNGTSVIAGLSKRKAEDTLPRTSKRQPLPPVFRRQPLPLVRGARDSETTLILENGKEVRGFDRTNL